MEGNHTTEKRRGEAFKNITSLHYGIGLYVLWNMNINNKNFAHTNSDVHIIFMHAIMF